MAMPAAAVEFLSVGHQVVPGVQLTCVRLAEPSAADLYGQKLAAMRAATRPYVCMVDGFGDRLLPGFAKAMEALAATGKPLGYAAELVHGRRRPWVPWTLDAYMQDHTIIHHGVVCRREALLAIDWPVGRYDWEAIAYGTLAQGGVAADPVPRYDWRPGPGGASMWADTADALAASKAWLRRSAAV